MGTQVCGSQSILRYSKRAAFWRCFMQSPSLFSPTKPFTHLRGLIPWVLGIWGALIVTFNWNIAPAQATSVYAIPQVSPGDATWIVDQAEVLSRLTQNELQEKLADLAQETGIELRLVTFRRLDYGDTIQTFADKLFAAWFANSDRQANEVLFALDVQTNYGSLHLGETAANLVDDETIASILDETLVAPLRDGNRYNQALLDITDRLGTILKGEPDPGPPAMTANFQVERTFASPEETKSSNATTIVIVLLIIATIVPMLTYFAYVR
jgi:uncharacterized protein